MPGVEIISPGRPLWGVRLVRPGVAEPNPDGEAGQQQREQAAYQRGIAAGEERLGQQLLQQRQDLLQLQQGVLDSLRQSVSQVVHQSETALIELALEVAGKLVSGLPINAEMVEAAVKGALAEVEESAELHITLHPDDLALLQQINSPVLLPGPGQEALHFQASSEVTRGGCVVQTRFGVIDARRETKLQLVRESLGV